MPIVNFRWQSVLNDKLNRLVTVRNFEFLVRIFPDYLFAKTKTQKIYLPKVAAKKIKSNPIFIAKHLLFVALLSFLFLINPFLSFCQQDSSYKISTGSDKVFHSLNTQSCTGSLGDPIVNFTFGSGSNFGPALAQGITSMQYVANACPNDGSYTITNYTTGCFSNAWHTVTDHTGDANGYYMLINASYAPSDFYVQQIDGLCSGTTYQFSAWIVNVLNTSGIAPNITFSIEKTDGTVLQTYNSGDIPTNTTPVWKQYGLYFTTPVGVTSVVIRMKNNAPGGNGNDLGLDDIAFRPAGPLTSIAASIQGDSINVCSSPVALTSAIETCYLSNEYQWQVNNNGNWVNIPGANTPSYTVPVQPPGKYRYRLLVSASGNIQVSNCRVSSNVITVVVVPAAIIRAVGAVICSGQTFTLPSGIKVNATGNYSDTVRYAFGCDSLITNLQLTVQSPIIVNNNAAICEGEIYTLPNGVNVSSPGTYRDTIKYNTGCDSLIRTINLIIKPVITKDSFVTICKGEFTILPWGTTVSSSGVYSDTARYAAGCDSLIKNVHVHVTIPVSQSIERFVCPGQTFTMPSGTVVSTPGFYNDTLRTPIGCDSLITFLTLSPAPPPTIQLSKSNDVNCTLGISKLNASGGSKYLWSPVETLSNAVVANPVARPAASTVYHVIVTTQFGCMGEDSIMVNVSADPSNSIYIPNAFTPNGDGINDCFGVGFLGQMSNLRFSIYDRWGNRVFYTSNPNQCWDGSYEGKALKSDVFIYQISGTTLCGKISKNGTVTLIR
jgi:gliding motility-associated-like protein